jgi:hypothetical protein
MLLKPLVPICAGGGLQGPSYRDPTYAPVFTKP